MTAGQLDTDGTRGTRDMTAQRQFDMAAAHIIKVRDRTIHEIEATGAVLPFNSKTAGATSFGEAPVRSGGRE